MSNNLERKNIEKTKIDWNEHADYWDDFDEARHYTKQIFGLLTDQVKLMDLNILDFGCGTGLLTDYMRKEARQIVGLDSAEKMIAVLNKKKYTNVESIVGELSKETVERHVALQNKFDLVVASSVCAFLPNYEEVLAIIKSLLKPGGTFVQWDWLRSEKDPGFGFTEDMIQKSFDTVGLTLSSVGIPFYLMEEGEKMEVLMAVGKT